MDYRNFIASVLCFFSVGCSVPLIYSNSEMQAQDHMRRAAALEDSKEYHQAAEEYAIVAERYSSTSYYQNAVRKAALLNLHPSNSEPDTRTALHWLKIYLTLPLSPEEKESAQLHLAMLENITRLQSEISRQNADINKLRTIKRKQSGKITTDTELMKKLETDLAQARVQLEEMKEVDLRMHVRRINGAGGKPVELVNKTPAISPEADSPATSTMKHPEPGKSEETATTQKDSILQTNDKGRAPLSGRKDTHPKKRGRYPYTIQISSFVQKEDAIRAAVRSRNKGDIGFTSHVHIPGKGDWYRVFIGFYQTRDEAERGALELKKREYPHAFAVKMPFAVRIEGSSSDKELKEMEEGLRSKGYLAYRVPDGRNDDRTALLIGAFGTKEETSELSKSVQKKGYKVSVIQR
ncbi:MAG: SPOR domain-containing protein [Deltaproteobacteria bacterium]|nr:SPOR domain-containing protein [Deltaproteobacteria bacterium]